MTTPLLDENLIYDVGTNPTQVEELNKQLQPPQYLPTSFPNEAQKKLNDILKTFNLKRGCCLQVEDPKNSKNYIIPILTKNKGNFNNTTLGNIYNKIGKYDNPTSFPKSLCSKLDNAYSNSNSTACQNLYATYCTKSINDYKKIFGNLNNFAEFKPECGCYIPPPDYIKKSGINIPQICFAPSCERKKGIMLDAVSANPATNCSITLCTANIDLGNVSSEIGGVSTINKINQNCGNIGGGNSNSNDFNLYNLVITLPNTLITLVDKTPLNKINNYISGGTSYLTYGSLLCSSLIFVVIIIVLIILLINKYNN